MRYRDRLILEAAEQGRDDLIELISETTALQELNKIEKELKEYPIAGYLSGPTKRDLPALRPQTALAVPKMDIIDVDFQEIEDVIDESKFKQLAKEGSIIAAIALLCAGSMTIIAKQKAIANKLDDMMLKRSIRKLEDELDDLKAEAKAGNISAVKALSEELKIKNQLRDLNKRVAEKAKGVSEEIAKKAVKESASTDQIKIAIYESCANYEITEAERDELLSMLD